MALVIDVLAHLLDEDLRELGVHAATALDEIEWAHLNYLSVNSMHSDLAGLGFRKHRFDLMSNQLDGRYVFREVSSRLVPVDLLPAGYSGPVLIPVWVSDKPKLKPDYTLAKRRIVKHCTELGLRDSDVTGVRI